MKFGTVIYDIHLFNYLGGKLTKKWFIDSGEQNVQVLETTVIRCDFSDFDLLKIYEYSEIVSNFKNWPVSLIIVTSDFYCDNSVLSWMINGFLYGIAGLYENFTVNLQHFQWESRYQLIMILHASHMPK